MKHKMSQSQIRRYQTYLLTEEHSESTVRKYLHSVSRFFAFLPADKAASKDRAVEWKESLVRQFAGATVNVMLSALNGFFTFMGWADYRVRPVRIQRRVYRDRDRELTKAEYYRLVAAAEKLGNRRLYYLLQTLGSTGIRISELPSITVEAVKRGTAMVNCKGKQRVILLPKRLRRALQDYCRERGLTTGAVFVTRSGRPMDRSNIWREMRALCGPARVDPHKVYPHNFRHLFAVSFYGLKRDIAKADRSDHLKLLFCIDMLNEGIHVEDVSGVILFRPTVSPIIYKQQIGRALSASKSTEPVIFDVVNNIENLYSIGTIEQEMRAAVNYYHFLGEDKLVVNEHFRLIDEVRDARALFEQLNDTLTASWDRMYGFAKQYAEKFGNLEVPRRYKTAEGYSLGSWIFTQRKVYAGESYGQLSEDRIRALEDIGMVWDNVRDLSWQRYFAAAEAYRQEYGDLNVKADYVTTDGVHLGSWITNLRTYRKSGIQNAYLTKARIAALDGMGMIWDVPDYLWEQNFAACMDYHRQHGNLNIPVGYCAPNGLKIGAWVSRLRALRQGKAAGAALTEEQVRRLDGIGMVWESKWECAWNRGCAEAERYWKEYGNLDVPGTYVSSSGFRLGSWLRRCRTKGRAGHTPERQRQLDALGMLWEKPDSWEVRYALAKAFYEANGHLRVPAQYRAEGVWLAKWLNEQKQIYMGKRPGKTLTTEQIRRLEAIGMTWGGNAQKRRSVQRHSTGRRAESQPE